MELRRCGCKRLDFRKSAGAEGAATLCATCGGRFRGGAKSAPRVPDTGKFKCDGAVLCRFIGALSGHRRFCDGGSWRSDRCCCTISEAGNRKNPGPKGPATLCGPCGGRYRGGATGPPTRNEAGGFVCDSCGRVHETLGGLAAHKRSCDGGNWRCGWCDASLSEVGGRRNPGPDGPRRCAVPAVRGGARAPRDLRPETTR